MWQAFTLLLLSTAPLTHAAFDASTYPRRVSIMSGAELYWKLNSPSVVTFAIVAPTTTGWVGFGLGEPNSGSMPGADVMIGTVNAASGAVTIGDYYTTDFITPTVDAVSQDWKAVSGSVNATSTIIEFSRSLIATNLAEDRSIEDTLNPIHMIFAYGSSSSLAYHGLAQRAMFTAYLFSTFDPYVDMIADTTATKTAWTNENYVIPSLDTIYQDTPCYLAPAAVNGQKPIIIGFDALITSTTPGLVHHMVVQAFTDTQCAGTPIDLWAVASNPVPLVLPKDVGLVMQYASYSVQIHFNNPSRLKNIVDNSGVTVYYTYVPRAKSAGVLQLGDPSVLTPGTLKGLTTVQYGCPAACTQLWSGAGITLVGELLHMHQTGASMSTTFVFPNGTKYSRTVEYFNFHNQQNVLISPTVIPPGTTAKTTCNYQVPSGGAVVFGPRSVNEMCIHFVYYYPLQQSPQGLQCGLGYCGGSLDAFAPVTALSRSFGSTSATPTAALPSVPGTAAAAARHTSFTVMLLAVSLLCGLLA